MKINRGDARGSSPRPWMATGVVFLVVGTAWCVIARRSVLRAARSGNHAADRIHQGHEDARPHTTCDHVPATRTPAPIA